MKKILFLFGITVLLSSCSSDQFYLYDGTEPVAGKGGIILYRDGDVAVYDNGLPNGKSCMLLGEYMDDREAGNSNSLYADLADKAVRYNGNTAVLSYSQSQMVSTSRDGVADYENKTKALIYNCK